jgi:methylmalonyl-CoA/ethylmalonyl-CoA epimerase
MNGLHRLAARAFLLAAALALAAPGAELPSFYKRVSRLTWVAKDAQKVASAWEKLGLQNVQDFGDIDFEQSEYRGKPAASGTAHVIAGTLGDIAIDIIQPSGGSNAFSDFLSRRGEGVFAVVHAVASVPEFDAEIARLKGLGVGLLQTASAGGGAMRIAYFDTEASGKYVLGLIYWPDAPPAGAPGKLSQVAFAVRDPETVSAYWEKLGLPKMTKSHSDPRDLTYRGAPARFGLDLYWQRHTQVAYEWCVPPSAPNFYSDVIRARGEGVHHLGVPVKDMDASIAEYEKMGYKNVQSGAWGEAGKKGSGRFAYIETPFVSAELLWSFQ